MAAALARGGKCFAYRFPRTALTTTPTRSFSSIWGTSGKALQVIDCHCGGEPARVVTGGLPHVPGSTAYEKRAYMMEHLDHYREMLLQEPRGYPCQNVNYILPPTDPKAAYSYVIAEQNKVYPAVSGHNTICVVTALLETGMVPMEEPTTKFSLEAPGGLIGVTATCKNGKVTNVTFENAPAFCEASHRDVIVSVPTLGDVRVDIAFGGMHYAIVDVQDLNLSIDPKLGRELCRVGEMIKVAAREQHPVSHPVFDYTGPDILVLREPTYRDEEGVLTGRNTVVMTNNDLDWNRPETWTAMLDRSPCGSGTSAVMALLHARGELKIGEPFKHIGIVGAHFVGELLRTTSVGEGEAAIQGVIPTISGQAWITQLCTVLVDPSDPFPRGYTVGDIW